jgi:hypothetical protein
MSAYQVQADQEVAKKAVKTKQIDLEGKVKEELKPVRTPVRVVFVYEDGTVKVIRVEEFKDLYPNGYEVWGVEE